MSKIKKILTSCIFAAVIIIVSAVVLINFAGTSTPPLSEDVISDLTSDLSIRPENSVYTESLSFSHLPGIYKSSFLLEMYPEAAGGTIRYTTDCTKPKLSSMEYTEPLRISTGKDSGDGVSVSVIRAAVFGSDGKQIGNEVTATYLVTSESDTRYSSMIISIVAEPDDLYDYDRGIMVEGAIAAEFRRKKPAGWATGNLNANYTQRGREWEREAHIEFFGSDGTVMMSQNGGIRISGGWTRTNSQKSFRIFARNEYEAGKSLFYCDLFPGLTSIYGDPINEFKSLLLRTGSNNNSSSVISSQTLMRLADNTDVFNAASRFAAVYVNGKYYGILGVYEDYSTQYFEARYGMESDYITGIKGAVDISGPTSWILDTGDESEFQLFLDMVDFISDNDMTNAANYSIACKMLDIENFVQYVCFQSYIGNWDWLPNSNNMRVWRYNKDGYNPDAEKYGFDGRWRFMLKDMDLSAGYGNDPNSGLTQYLNAKGTLKVNDMFRSLFKNEQFKALVAATYCDFINSIFETSNVLYSITEMQLASVGEMQYFLNYYNYNGKRLSSWDSAVARNRKYFVDRYTFAMKDMVKVFGVSWNNVSVDISEGGSLKINTLTLDSSYNGTPLNYLGEISYSFNVIPDDGWELKSISVDGGKYSETDKTISLNGAGKAVSIKAEFVKSADYTAKTLKSGLIINEIKYQAVTSDTTPDWIEIYNNSDKSIYLKDYQLIYVKNGGDIRKAGDIKGEFKFPSVTIEPYEYLVIVCDGNQSLSNKYTLHAGFKLAHGYDLVLAVNSVSGEIDRASMPKNNLKTGLSRSLARNPDTGDWMTMNVTQSTPYKKNTTAPMQYDIMSTVPVKQLYGKTFLNMGNVEGIFIERAGKEGLWIKSDELRNFLGSSTATTQLINRLKGYSDDNGYYTLDQVMNELTSHQLIYIKSLNVRVYLKIS